MVILQRFFEGVFRIWGTPSPDHPYSDTFRNNLTVVSFVKELDGAVLRCGAEGARMGFFRLRVYSECFLHACMMRREGERERERERERDLKYPILLANNLGNE